MPGWGALRQVGVPAQLLPCLMHAILQETQGGFCSLIGLPSAVCWGNVSFAKFSHTATLGTSVWPSLCGGDQLVGSALIFVLQLCSGGCTFWQIASLAGSVVMCKTCRSIWSHAEYRDASMGIQLVASVDKLAAIPSDGGQVDWE